MDIRVINGIRNLAIDMIDKARDGHPGIALSAAPLIYTLFANHLNFNKDDANWLNRDRFILCSKEASTLLYSMLFYAGYNIDLEELRNHRKSSSKFGAYAELDKSVGIEFTSGLTAEGLATSVGVAIAEEYLKELLGRELINFNTYVLINDSDLMSGISYEAASLAGSLKLGHLIVLYTSSGVTEDGKKENVFDEDVIKRFEAMGWHTEVVSNGEDYLSIDKAIERAKQIMDKPSIIEVKSILGIGTSVAGTPLASSTPLSDKDMILVKEKMNLSEVPFHVSKEAVMYFRDKVDKRVSAKYNEWAKRYNQVLERDEVKRKLIVSIEDGNIRMNLRNLKVNFDTSLKEDMRNTNENLLNVMAGLFPLLIGGSTDKSKRTQVYIKDGKDFKGGNQIGKNISFGSRESAMGSILNGIALCGLRPFGSTLLAYSDYLKPSMRLSAMMNLPVTYIFTHDTFKMGSEGSIYTPVEELGNLRSIPNLKVFRPADVNELVGSWDYILNKKVPSALIIPNELKEILNGSSLDGTEKGAYIIKQERGRLSGIIISTGSEVSTSLEVSSALDRKGINTRVISMPSVEIFNSMKDEYKSELLPMGSKVIVIEASNDSIWNRFVYSSKYLLNITDYIKSKDSMELLEENDYTLDKLIEKCEKLLK